uniref:G-protein coupled receptors family 1 profile domain-containing protein n=1 Tax=Erpetoichthys calabaricus TaxID=27687 RepID=A0A8C4RGI0_ERPCA
ILLHSISYCPPPENTTYYGSLETNIILFIVFMIGMLVTTFGNLIVIISIIHFQQLHTPTNVLTLSMAIADFLIGIFIMPVKLIQTMDKCWDLGVYTCMASIFFYGAITAISITHLIFLSVDRYYAVCYPLHYSTKITIKIALVFAAVSWSFSIFITALLFYVQFTFVYRDKNVSVGISWFVTDLIVYIVDMLFNCLLPFSVMVTLYSKILIVAIQHSTALRNVGDEVWTVQKKKKKGLIERQNKATITIGIVIGTFFSFVSQYYICALLSVFIIIPDLALNIVQYFVLFNYALNPLIYGLFYPWFRKAFKFIITFKIFKPGSSLINLLSENK